MKAGNQSSLKRNNQKAITEYIIKNGPISRADLSKILDISKPTVSTNVAGLIEENLLKEIGYSKTEVGKKPMLLDFNKDYSYVLVLDFISYIKRGSIVCAVSNLYCETIFSEKITVPWESVSQTIRNDLPNKIFELLKKYDISIEKIGVLVLTAPTSVYDENHIDFECFNGDIINLAEIFSPWFKNKIAVKNDVNLAALGEKYFGVGQERENLLYVWAGLAVGGAIILNGELYEGKNIGVGEIAHCLLYDEDRQNYCELKNLVNSTGIKQYVENHYEDALKSSISEHIKNNTYFLDMISEAAKDGDKFCANFGRYIGRKFAQIIFNLVYTLDLQMCIIGGEYVNFEDIFLDEIKKVFDNLPDKEIEVSQPLHYNSAIYGAFKFGADKILSNIISE